jgi:hypothetical protein
MIHFSRFLCKLGRGVVVEKGLGAGCASGHWLSRPPKKRAERDLIWRRRRGGCGLSFADGGVQTASFAINAIFPALLYFDQYYKTRKWEVMIGSAVSSEVEDLSGVKFLRSREAVGGAVRRR